MGVLTVRGMAMFERIWSVFPLARSNGASEGEEFRKGLGRVSQASTTGNIIILNGMQEKALGGMQHISNTTSYLQGKSVAKPNGTLTREEQGFCPHVLDPHIHTQRDHSFTLRETSPFE